MGSAAPSGENPATLQGHRLGMRATDAQKSGNLLINLSFNIIVFKYRIA
jgi:hypothetical protein